MAIPSNGPQVIHLIGVSIPRSGHHHLSKLLQEILGQDLHYCEYYTPLDCCRRVPCERRGSARVIFQKNHDLDMSLDANLPGVLYVVQTRAPLLEALSDRELAEAVRPELAGDLDELVVWLGRKAAYYCQFHRKWVDGGPANRILIPYETLLQSPAEVLRNLLQRAGISVSPQAIDTAVARRAGVSAGGTKRFTPREPKPAAVARPLFDAFTALLAEDLNQPAPRKSHDAAADNGVHAALRLAMTAHVAGLAHDLPARTAAWREFCRRFPENPYGHVELSRCLEERGEPREALRAVLRAARQAPPRLEAVKRTRDLLARSGRHRAARRLSSAIAQRFSDSPTALIDLAVDLFHSGQLPEAVAAARRFSEVAAAVPYEGGSSILIWNLRCMAHGFNVPLYWEAACHIFLAGGEAERALDAARVAHAMSGENPAWADLVARAQQAVGLP
jgi:hypothetical protein